MRATMKLRGYISITLMLMVVLACVRADSMGYIRHGGSFTVGLSLSELTDTTGGPVTPLNSILIDEHVTSVIPLDAGSGFASWEQRDPERLRLRIAPGVVLSGDEGINIFADIIAGKWMSLSEQRWDALWALRYIAGMGTENAFGNFEVVDEYTLDLKLVSDVGKETVLRALKSPALQLDFSNNVDGGDGAGPFIRWRPSNQRHRFTAMNFHYAGRPYIDEFTVIAYPSAEESVLDFGRGSLDGLLLTSGELSRYKGSSRAEPDRVATVGSGLIILVFNPVSIPNPDERRAYTMAANRESLAQVVLGEGSTAAIDFSGTAPQPGELNESLNAARDLFSSLSDRKSRLNVLVPDDPAAKATAGRLRANFESLGVPVDLVQDSGPLKLSMNADIIILSLRLIDGSEGTLPQCLALYDRNGWWDIAGLALPAEDRGILRSVRNLDPESDLNILGSALQNANVIVPLVKYNIFFAPGPEIELVSDKVFPGTLFWRAFTTGQ